MRLANLILFLGVCGLTFSTIYTGARLARGMEDLRREMDYLKAEQSVLRTEHQTCADVRAVMPSAERPLPRATPTRGGVQ